MPDKEFETKVRESLEALNLEPSPQVWKALSARIRTGKKRRILFWLPLLVLLMGMGAWRIWYWEGQAIPSPGQRQAANQQGLDNQKGGGQRAAGQTGRSQSVSANPATRPSETGNPASSQSGASRPETGVSETETPKTETPKNETPETGVSETGWGLLTRATGLPPDPYAFNPLNVEPRKPTLPAIDTTLYGAFRDPVANPRWHKWQSRVYAGAGVSGQGALLRFYTPTGSASGVNIPATYYNSGGGSASAVGVGTSANKYTTAARRSGAGFEAGFEEQYRFARQWKIQAGLEYAYWETAFARVINPGAYLSASAGLPVPLGNYGYPENIYIASSSGQVYVNRYSLFQLPVGISWLIAPSGHLNPSLHTGISLGYLSGSHVLQYTPDSVTYRAGPPDQLRHWSFYWEGGFDIEVYHRKSSLFYLGPVVQYGLSGLQTQGSVKDHLNYAGLRLGMGFK